MRSHRVAAIADYLSPGSEHWARVRSTRITMMPTPLGMQPTAYIQASWAGRRYGETPVVEAASVHDGMSWAVHIGWAGVAPSGEAEFPDAVAVALPIARDAVLALMGSDAAPIHYLRWDASHPDTRSVVARGLGTSAPGPDVRQAAQAVVKGHAWQVVITRALGSGKDAAPLAVGTRTGIGFAVWRGGNAERAGIKAFSRDWTELELDA